MELLNLGILAHVDAGKTGLTERILFETGVIKTIGSVDKGTTQTDTLELERARGITIKSAVVSFQINERKINLIDTPGHADFVAEVERSLDVLDGVVLVVSAVEGVQPQTRRLARAVRAAGLPLLIFVNKIDRLGARPEAVAADLRVKLDLHTVLLSAARDAGEQSAAALPRDPDDRAFRDEIADTLAESSEAVIAAFDRYGGDIPWFFLEAELKTQVAAGAVAPVYLGSAITGAGVDALLHGLGAFLPAATGANAGPPSGRVFKIARRPSGEKLVYVRLFAGSIAVRQRLTLHRTGRYGDREEIDERITGLDRFISGQSVQVDRAGPDEIACLHGLREARIGDRFGEEFPPGRDQAFNRPALESVVRPVNAADITKLRTALENLAEQDPLISLRQRNAEGEISVRLFGEVQKEVIVEMLLREFGVDASFGPSQTICIERVTGTGEARSGMGDRDNPYVATIGFRIEPGEPGSGIIYRRELGSLPPAFYRAIEETVFDWLTQGLYGWEVVDCVVTLTETGYASPVTVAADFRKLVPLVLFAALAEAGTEVCEPLEQLELEIPEDTFGAVFGALIAVHAEVSGAVNDGETQRVTGKVPAAELRSLEQQLPGLTRGEGGWSSQPAGHRPVHGEPPVRPRIGPNPLNRLHYLAEVARA
jgi:ribosomal protection tetracycline resistance protein